MPHEGVEATIEIFDEYLPGLLRIEENSHIMIVGWLHKIERRDLLVRRPKYSSDQELKGVFACRTPARPNPFGITTVKLLKVEGKFLYVERLDMIDGTPILDIKPHSAGFDGVFSARSGRDLSRYLDPDPQEAYRKMLEEAVNFHGEKCIGLSLGVRAMYEAIRRLQSAQKDRNLIVIVGISPYSLSRCISDALQALSGASLGNGRLRLSNKQGFAFRYLDREIRFHIKHTSFFLDENILSYPVEKIFDIVESTIKPVSAILLAAGESTRMGKQKLLLPLGNMTMVEQSLENLLNSRVKEVIVVLGCNADEITPVIEKKNIRLVINQDFRLGMSSSIKAGISEISKDTEGVMIALADQPLIPPEIIDILIESFSGDERGIVLPVFKGLRGHPVIFDLKYKYELMAIDGDVGLRGVVKAHIDDLKEVEVDCPGILKDIDVMEDYLSIFK